MGSRPKNNMQWHIFFYIALKFTFDSYLDFVLFIYYFSHAYCCFYIVGRSLPSVTQNNMPYLVFSGAFNFLIRCYFGAFNVKIRYFDRLL